MNMWWRVAALTAVAAGCSPAKPIPLMSPLVSPLASPLAAPGGSAGTLLHEPFNVIDPRRWREIEVKGRTEFSIEDLDGQRVLKARSESNASILLCQVRFDPDEYPWVSWRWRIDHVLEKEDLRTKAGSDAPARVYVYFDTPGLPWQKRNLDYVWSSNLPAGTALPSAYAKSSIILVVDSGPEHVGAWRTVSRNLKEDYRAAFPGSGTMPNVLAIGLLTDADSTATSATAYYDDVMITREPAYPPASDGGKQPAVP